jgi:glycosyltransferase involved in cell wall biosynthesis
MDISVVVPLYNEEESLPELFAWIKRVMDTNHFTYEVIFVNDGSTDHSWNVIEKLASENKEAKGIKFRRNYGKSPALFCGFEKAQGDVVITMDADLQDSPDEIPELYRMITEEGYDLVSGYKQKRYDPLSKTIPTKLFNATARAVSGIKNLHDFNCGLKAYRKEVIKNIEVYGEMHRYIPYLAKNAGFKKIGEKVVKHQARKYGTTKFGLNRFVNGYLDLISLWFLSKFGIKPMHIFGLLGSLMFILGFFAVAYIGILIGGVAFAAIPMGYGAYVYFFGSALPIALYELGVRIAALGATMLTSILLYNYVRRLVPFLFKQIKKLYKLCNRITKRYFQKTVKEEN